MTTKFTLPTFTGTIPNEDTITSNTATQILTNKTIVAPTIKSSAGGTWILPPLADSESGYAPKITYNTYSQQQNRSYFVGLGWTVPETISDMWVKYHATTMTTSERTIVLSHYQMHVKFNAATTSATFQSPAGNSAFNYALAGITDNHANVYRLTTFESTNYTPVCFIIQPRGTKNNGDITIELHGSFVANCWTSFEAFGMVNI